MIEVEREENAVGAETALQRRYRWHVRGRPEINGLSSEPLLDACRVLKSMGEDPLTQVGLFRPGRTAFDLRTTVEYGAGKTVQETQRQGIRFVDYVPFDPAKRISGRL
jgi:hypothetical protein